MLIVVTAVGCFGERTDPMDQTSVRHPAVPDHASRTCRDQSVICRLITEIKKTLFFIFGFFIEFLNIYLMWQK